MATRMTLGSIAGIDVRVHRSWVLIALLIVGSFLSRFVVLGYALPPAVVMALAGALLFFTSVLVHEFAHALEAQHRGVQVRGITLFLFGGATEMSGEVRRPRDEFAVTAIGPFSSFVLAALFGLVAVYTGRVGLAAVAQVAGMLGWINLALGVFNLLPGAPLDGGRILRALVWALTGDRRRALRVAARAGQLIGALIMGLGLLQLLLVPGAALGGIWFVVIGGFLMFAAQSEIAHQSLDQALGEMDVGELLRRGELVSTPSDTDLGLAVEQLRLAPEGVLEIVEEGRSVGVLLLEDVARLQAERRAGRTVEQVMVPVEQLPRVDHRTPVTDALGELAGQPALAVTSRLDGQDRIEGVVAPEQLQRIVRRTLQLGEPASVPDSASSSEHDQHLPAEDR